MVSSLLPPNATPLENNLANTCARISNVPSLPALWDPDNCPVNLLPWLAWALSVDEWDSSWQEAVQRDAIKQARDIHRKKGTVGSVKRALSSLGFGDSVIVEGLDAALYNGAVTYDGTHYYGPDSAHWALYNVYLTRAITPDQASHVRRILEAIAPARSKLDGLYYTGVNNIYDGTISYDGTATYGAL